MTSLKKSLKNRHDSYMVVQFVRTVCHCVCVFLKRISFSNVTLFMNNSLVVPGLTNLIARGKILVLLTRVPLLSIQ